jgi:ribosomal protein L21
MTDKEKELKDTENKPSDDGIKIKFTPSDENVGPFITKKSSVEIQLDQSKQANVSNSLDINANLGSFGSDSIPVEEKNPPVVKNGQIDKQIPTDGKNSKIDFEKFERRKKVKTKTALGIKLDI